MITNYIPNKCKYSVNNLKKVVHIFSSASNKVYIDNGEAYVTGGITDFQTISATSVEFAESTSYDDRFKFQKTVTVTVDGFLKLSALGGKYYVVLEDENGILWLVNADFPSLVTYTYTLTDNINETVFTFNVLSNFPSLKLSANVNNSYTCKQYSAAKIKDFKMLEKKYANIDAQSGIIYGYSNRTYKTVNPNEGSIKLEETFDGTNVTTNIQFNINFDDYQSSWHYNLLEYPDNKYVAVIDHLACGFEMGLVPSYNVQGSHQINQGDIVTVTLVGSSQRGSEWANSWTEVTIAPAYTWKLSKEWVCVTPPFGGKFKLTLSDSSTVTAACDSTSAITSGEVATQYSGTVVSAEIGDCVTSINRSAFRNCRSLTSVTIPDSVTRTSWEAFQYCRSLTSIDIPNSVTSIGDYSFDGCYSLTSITIPSGVTSINQYTFAYCSGLTKVNSDTNGFCNIPSNVTSIWISAFQYCRSLTSVNIPSGVTSIGSHAFRVCTSLTSITVNAPTPPTLGIDVFYSTNNCPIYVPSASVEAYKSASGWSEYADRIQPIP